MKSTTRIPNPGSPKAVALGCLCDPEENNRGAGNREEDPREPRWFWIHRDCPIHKHMRIKVGEVEHADLSV